MRRIVTAREQYALRLHWADSTGAAAGETDACDPMVEDCSSTGTDDKAKPGNTPAGASSPEVMPSAGSNSPSFYDPKSKSAPSAYSAPSSSSGGSGATSAPVSFSPGAGVAQWHDEVLQGLQRNGLPATLAPQVEKQMQSESSGNPNAINNWDSNAQAGHPSQGLLQTIPSTFQQYHLPGDSMSITDPQANIDSAIGYAKERYGPTLMNNGGGMGSGHGY